MTGVPTVPSGTYCLVSLFSLYAWLGSPGVGLLTCDSTVVSSNPGDCVVWSLSGNNLGQVFHTHVLLSPSSKHVNWHRCKSREGALDYTSTTPVVCPMLAQHHGNGDEHSTLASYSRPLYSPVCRSGGEGVACGAEPPLLEVGRANFENSPSPLFVSQKYCRALFGAT